jgi:hypothetical protein
MTGEREVENFTINAFQIFKAWFIAIFITISFAFQVRMTIYFEKKKSEMNVRRFLHYYK